MTTLKNTKKSVKWTALKTIFQSILQPIYRILLALLLSPTEFGYIAVIIMVVSFGELLNNLGIGEAIILHQNVTKNDLSSLFFFNFFITLLFTVILFFSAILFENYYSMDNLVLIIQSISIVLLINGSTSIFKFYLHKEFLFKITSIIQMIKISIEILLSILLIILGYGVWGFVIGVILSNLVHGILITILVFKKTNFQLSWYISYENIVKYLSFGLYVAAKKILNFFSHRIDEILIGGLLSADILGAYYLAKSILNQLQALITTSFGQILLPLFSKINQDYLKLKQLYLKIFILIALIGFPLFFGVSITAQWFVPVFFGNEWIESILVFQTLSIPTLAILLSAGISTSLLYSVNKPKLVFYIDLIAVSLYSISLFVFNNGQLVNILFVYSLYILSKFIVIQFFIAKTFGITISNYYEGLKGIIFSTIIMVVTTLFISNTFNDQFKELVIFTISITWAISMYVCCSFIFNKKQTINTIILIKSIIKKN